MERNCSIDLLKFIFSFFVVAIHTSLFKNINTTLYHITTMGLMRIAVPFFFVVSGYYYYQRIKDHKDVRGYLKKLISIWIVFEGIELLLYTIPMMGFIKEYGVFVYLWKAFSVGLGGAYWYLTSLVISLFLLGCLWKKEKIMPLFLLGLILYLCVFTHDSYSVIFENTWIQQVAGIHTKIWTWPQAGLCSSLFYLSMGAYLNEKRPQIKHIEFYLCLSLICLLFEAFILQGMGAYDGNCYLSLMIVVPLLFIMTQKYGYFPLNTHILGQMSLYIYMIHPIVLNILRVIPLLNSSMELLFMICIVITSFLSYMIVKSRGK